MGLLFFASELNLIGPGGPWADTLAAIWLVLIVLALFLIPRFTRIRLAQRLGVGIRPRLGESGLPSSPKVRAIMSALIVILALTMLLFWLMR